jgi:LacI family transcriptional regulator
MNMGDEKKIRIIDIADELGVSTATVSNVIHGKTKKISDATVRRVQEKLVERGYIPNMAATLLSQNNSRIVGVVVNNHPKYEGHVLEDPYISSAVNVLSDALESHGPTMAERLKLFRSMAVRQMKTISEITLEELPGLKEKKEE